jgi:hypothetical protein
LAFTKQARERFARNRRQVLREHLGRDPTFPEQIIIGRCIALEWELLRQDAKLQRGEELSGHDIRGRLAAENRLRLDLMMLDRTPHRHSATPTWQETLGALHGKSDDDT